MEMFNIMEHLFDKVDKNSLHTRYNIIKKKDEIRIECIHGKHISRLNDEDKLQIKKIIGLSEDLNLDFEHVKEEIKDLPEQDKNAIDEYIYWHVPIINN